ncbi:MAG: phage tail tube protein [Methylobacterium frigidaeris]
MAQPSTLPFSAVAVKLESATTANSFEAPCGLTERAVQFTKETNSVAVPDCADEDAAPFVDRTVVSKSVTINGKGVMARGSLARWRAAFEADAPVRARVEVAGAGAGGGGRWEGLFHLTSFEVGAIRGERCTVAVAMQSSGAVPFTAAA